MPKIRFIDFRSSDLHLQDGVGLRNVTWVSAKLYKRGRFELYILTGN